MERIKSPLRGSLFIYSSAVRSTGPRPMQLVVPSAVSAAVSAATRMRIATSQKFFFSIVVRF